MNAHTTTVGFSIPGSDVFACSLSLPLGAPVSSLFMHCRLTGISELFRLCECVFDCALC